MLQGHHIWMDLCRDCMALPVSVARQFLRWRKTGTFRLTEPSCLKHRMSCLKNSTAHLTKPSCLKNGTLHFTEPSVKNSVKFSFLRNGMFIIQFDSCLLSHRSFEHLRLQISQCYASVTAGLFEHLSLQVVSKW